MRHITLAGIVVVLGQLAGGCGGVAERGPEPTPSAEPPPSTTGSVSGSVSLGDGAKHTQLSGVAYYEDFFVEGVAVSIVPWAGAHCGVGGGFAPGGKKTKAVHDAKCFASATEVDITSRSTIFSFR